MYKYNISVTKKKRERERKREKKEKRKGKISHKDPIHSKCFSAQQILTIRKRLNYTNPMCDYHTDL
jgi:hypothetical protein